MTSSPDPAPRPHVSTRGPRLLTATGVVVMLMAVGAVVLAATLMMRTLPIDVLAADGGPGPGAAGVVEVPGTSTMTLAEGDHAVWLAVPGDVGGTALDGEIEVTGPDGSALTVRSRPSVTGSTERGGVVASTVAGFEAPADGEYTVTAPAHPVTDDARLLVVEDAGFAPFFGGLMGTMGSVFLAVGLGAVGIGLTAGGAIWWYRRRATAGATAASGTVPAGR